MFGGWPLADVAATNAAVSKTALRIRLLMLLIEALSSS